MNNMLEVFGKNYFSELELKKRVPSSIFKEFKAVQRGERDLSLGVADVIATAVKNWAIENGATHYTHWFQPLTELTAEKHDAFIAVSSNGEVLSQFSGKELIKGESDGSSFPSGGLRSTFEARGYTAWDVSSPMFLKGEGISKTLYIPTAFVGYHGEALDKKVPLLRANTAIENQALRVLKILGDHETTHVETTLGVEQEYFLVEKKYFEKRPDLMLAGRTVFGSLPPKGQELNDHYYGTIKERVEVFMAELDAELWKLGVVAKTKHNEVAPNQFEIALMFASANVAVDQNQLVMDMIKKVAHRHNLSGLLHEKPFAGVNGSGKHCNWSLSANGRNLLDPSNLSQDNLEFLVFLMAVVESVDKHSAILRASTATPGNDHRLGGHEAPPAIISVFLGEELQYILENIGHIVSASQTNDVLELGSYNFPKIPKDVSDRNRTSPFAFTGNKFEFRMPGSSASPSTPAFIINTIVTDTLRDYADYLENCSADKDMKECIVELVKERYNRHKRILFNGNGYDHSWVEEAAKRGLPNLKNTVEALPVWLAETTAEVFEKSKVLTKAELESRFNVYCERFNKQVNIEAATAIRMGRNQIYPALLTHITNVSQMIVSTKKALGSDDLVETDKAHLIKVIELKNSMKNVLGQLEADLTSAVTIEDGYKRATYSQTNVVPKMKELRSIVDALELMMEKSLWPIPTYEDLLFKL